MPAGDKTGPRGQGSRTGRANGLCSGNSTPGYANDENRGGTGRGTGNGSRGLDRGLRKGHGFGKGRR